MIYTCYILCYRIIQSIKAPYYARINYVINIILLYFAIQYCYIFWQYSNIPLTILGIPNTHPVLDSPRTNNTLIQSVLIIILAKRLVVNGVKRSSNESFLYNWNQCEFLARNAMKYLRLTANVACKAIQMVRLIQSCASRSS